MSRIPYLALAAGLGILTGAYLADEGHLDHAPARAGESRHVHACRALAQCGTDSECESAAFEVLTAADPSLEESDDIEALVESPAAAAICAGADPVAAVNKVLAGRHGEHI